MKLCGKDFALSLDFGGPVLSDAIDGCAGNLHHVPDPLLRQHPQPLEDLLHDGLLEAEQEVVLRGDEVTLLTAAALHSPHAVLHPLLSQSEVRTGVT